MKKICLVLPNGDIVGDALDVDTTIIGDGFVTGPAGPDEPTDDEILVMLGADPGAIRAAREGLIKP